MINIDVLLENGKDSREFIAKHGLSIVINNGIQSILLDVGPDGSFLKNANKMGIEISGFRTLVLSHSHLDHTGGLDHFCSVNKAANIILFDSPSSRYFVSIFGILRLPVSLKAKPANMERIRSLHENIQIDRKTWFIRNTCHDNKKPSFNKNLLKHIDNNYITDTFDHEGILVLEDDGELAVFNSCSHNGVINSIESVKQQFKGMKIRSYVGGFHFHDPIGNRDEEDGSLDSLVKYIKPSGIRLYTGHCTGDYPFEYLKKELGEQIVRMRTGYRMSV